MMANQPHPSKRAVTWRLHRDLVAAVQQAAGQRGETVLAFVTRALERELAEPMPAWLTGGRQPGPGILVGAQVTPDGWSARRLRSHDEITQDGHIDYEQR